MQSGQTRGQRLLSLVAHLRSGDSGLLGEGARFLFAGGVVVVVYVTTTIVLSDVAGLHFQIALAIGFAMALLVQFTLYRRFVWGHHEEFALRTHHQIGRYLTIAAVGYGLTALTTAVLPKALGVPTDVVYLATVVALPIINFMVSRRGVFHPGATDENLEPDQPEATSGDPERVVGTHT